MRFIKSFLRVNSRTLYKKKKLPMWAHPHKDFFHSDKDIVSQTHIKMQVL